MYILWLTDIWSGVYLTYRESAALWEHDVAFPTWQSYAVIARAGCVEDQKREWNSEQQSLAEHSSTHTAEQSERKAS